MLKEVKWLKHLFHLTFVYITFFKGEWTNLAFAEFVFVINDDDIFLFCVILVNLCIHMYM
jgi:hypothetical protein